MNESNGTTKKDKAWLLAKRKRKIAGMIEKAKSGASSKSVSAKSAAMDGFESAAAGAAKLDKQKSAKSGKSGKWVQDKKPGYEKLYYWEDAKKSAKSGKSDKVPSAKKAKGKKTEDLKHAPMKIEGKATPKQKKYMKQWIETFDKKRNILRS